MNKKEKNTKEQKEKREEFRKKFKQELEDYFKTITDLKSNKQRSQKTKRFLRLNKGRRYPSANLRIKTNRILGWGYLLKEK